MLNDMIIKPEDQTIHGESGMAGYAWNERSEIEIINIIGELTDDEIKEARRRISQNRT